MEELIAGSGILTIIVLVAAVLAFLIPFFILKIRNQVVSMNKKMDTIIKLLRSASVNQTAGSASISDDKLEDSKFDRAMDRIDEWWDKKWKK